MGAQLHRHAGHPGGKVGAVIEFEAAQEVLVGLAGAAVRGDHDARDRFKQRAGAQQRTAFDELRRDAWRMQRFTISLDDKLAEEFGAWIAEHAYANRCEAVRDHDRLV